MAEHRAARTVFFIFIYLFTPLLPALKPEFILTFIGANVDTSLRKDKKTDSREDVPSVRQYLSWAVCKQGPAHLVFTKEKTVSTAARME